MESNNNGRDRALSNMTGIIIVCCILTAVLVAVASRDDSALSIVRLLLEILLKQQMVVLILCFLSLATSLLCTKNKTYKAAFGSSVVYLMLVVVYIVRVVRWVLTLAEYYTIVLTMTMVACFVSVTLILLTIFIKVCDLGRFKEMLESIDLANSSGGDSDDTET